MSKWTGWRDGESAAAMRRAVSRAEGSSRMSRDVREWIVVEDQYARIMATGVEGRRKRSSRWCWIVTSESRWRMRRYWVWLKARSLVREVSQVRSST